MNGIESALAEALPLPALTPEMLHPIDSAAMWSDSRRFPRYQAGSKCLLQPSHTYAESGHQSIAQQVWLRDLARGGVRFIHAAQLFPGERCDLHLNAQTQRQCEIVWCRRIAQGTFVSGGHFIADSQCERRASR